MIRVALRIAAMAATLILYLPLHYLWRLTGQPSPWSRRFLASVARIAGMRVHTAGTPLSRHVLFVANHASWIDIIALAGATGTAFVSKAEVARWPVIGWLARLNATVFVARADRSAVRGQADALRDALASGQPVALFPEGTTDGGAEVLPFRPALLAALFPPLPDVRLQPVAIDYGPAAGEIAWVGQESALSNARRVLSRKGVTPVAIRFLAPMEPAALGDRKALAEASRAAIVAALPHPAGTAGGPKLRASAAPADRL